MSKKSINPLLKGILKKTPLGEDPKKGGRPYTAPGKTRMDGTPIAKAFKQGYTGK
tara:strand:+ start:765 stop:929 length:165 start_codon:yes stop_codon:yes gene_type:complete